MKVDCCSSKVGDYTNIGGDNKGVEEIKMMMLIKHKYKFMCTNIPVHVYMQTKVYAYTYSNMCLNRRSHACVYLYMQKNDCRHICKNTHTYMHVHR